MKVTYLLGTCSLMTSASYTSRPERGAFYYLLPLRRYLVGVEVGITSLLSRD